MSSSSDASELSLEALSPNIPDPSVVETLLKDKYGLTTTSLTSLDGYDDKNYHAKVKDETCNPYLEDVAVREFFVKVINTRDSKLPEFINGQKLVMEHLNKHGVHCQEEIKNLDGEHFSGLGIVTKNGIKETCVVSVRTFLPGTTVYKHTATPALLYELGFYLAKVHTAFQDFHADFYDTFDCTWSLNNVPNIRSVVHAVQDYDNRKLVTDILDTFDEQVLPNKDKFRRGQIHGDPNEQNILLTADDSTHSGFAVSGLLDFQDTARTHPVYDLAMLCCYMMMVTHSDVPPLDVAGYVLSGYLPAIDLGAEERSCLPTLIASRMCMSLVYGAYTFMQNPGNDYVMTTAKKGWEVISDYWLTSKVKVQERWDEIVETYKPAVKQEQ